MAAARAVEVRGRFGGLGPGPPGQVPQVRAEPAHLGEAGPGPRLLRRPRQGRDINSGRRRQNWAAAFVSHRVPPHTTPHLTRVPYKFFLPGEGTRRLLWRR